ncbi:alcohol dehydrogenase catalytic domain-containing protein [Bacillus sp. SA1-12]|uniref:alcohol dehydrogenase catalytic domain-containing protein n=1 Tax=Bacillus sp. SA1-12 TaxID=1455638 RepID=UPI0018CE1AF4|nr:alcohol dehydrogenase catalytic domain-containing protein [Bacillus sp. SA1-12]
MMRASIYHNVNDFRMEDIDVPEIGFGEVLLKLKACGLCGTDIHKAIHKTVNPKTILGHEYAGEIVKVGEGVTKFKTGDRVVGAIHVPCFTCHYCQRQQYTLCPEFKETNIDPGGFAEYIRLSERHVRHLLFKIPDSLSYLHASLAEPVACCIHGQKAANIRPGDNVLIMGAGPIGLIHGQLLKHKDVSNVIISDVSAYKLSKAKEYGIDHTVNIKGENLKDVVDKVTNNQGVDTVIIAASVSSLLPEAVQLLRRGGRVICFSPFDKNPEVTIDAGRFFKDEISIVGTYSVSPYEFEEAILNISNGTIDAEKMITHEMTIDQVGEAITLAANPDEEVIKVVIID